MKNQSLISEAQLRRIVREELDRIYPDLMEEGMWDDVKTGAKKLVKQVSDAFKKAASGWVDSIREKLEGLSDIPEEEKIVMDAIRSGIKKTGEKLELDQTLKDAKELKDTDVSQVLQSDLEGGVHDKAEQLSEIYDILSDHRYTRKSLAEGVGIALGILGGLPMLLKGIKKLAEKLGATSFASLCEKAIKLVHKVENFIVDIVVPDRLSYHVYDYLHSHAGGEKFFLHTKGEGTELLTFEKYKETGKEHGSPREKTEQLIYKSILIFFLFEGLHKIFEESMGLLGSVLEGGAVSVKGVEVAAGLGQLKKIVS